MHKISLKKLLTGERGSTMLESLIAIILMCLIFFGVMQIFHFAMVKMVANYAAFNGGKAMSLGYTKRIIDKTIRLSSIGISGDDYSSPKLSTIAKTKSSLRDRLQLYLMSGNANVDFEYWDPMRSSDPELKFYYSKNDGLPQIETVRVVLEDAPMLEEGVAKLLQIGTDKASPSGSFTFYNYSEKYLDNSYW